MNFLTATIYGFGKWRDFSISFTDGEVNLISGENEAGKSTLRQFLLFMLFGLSPKERQFFQPKTGGTMGGTIRIETSEYGEVVIERIHDKHNGRAICRLITGEEYGEEWLSRLLGGITRSVYESIYTFSAEDLTKLRNITGNELGEVLLNIGLTGSDQIYQTEKWLDKQVNDLFKPKGKVPEVNQQLQVVESLAQKLSMAEAEEGKYKGLLEQKHERSKKLEGVEAKLTKIRKEQYSYQQVLKALPLIQEYHQLESSVGNEHSYFPEEGKERFQSLKEGILPLESEKHMLEERLFSLQEKVEGLQSELASKGKIEQAESIVENQKKYEHAVHDLEQLKKRSNDLYGQVNHDLNYMNIPIEVDELNEYQFPFYIEETWRELKNESNNVDRQQVTLSEREESLYVQQEQVKNRLHELEQIMISETEAIHYSKRMDVLLDAYNSNVDDPTLHGKKNKRIRVINLAFLITGLGWLIAFFTSDLGIGIGATLLGMMVALMAYNMHRSTRQLEESTNGPQEENSVNQDSFHEVQRKLQNYEKNKSEWIHLQEQLKQLSQEDIRLEEKRNHLLQQQRRIEAGICEQKTLYPFLTSLDIDHWEKLYHLLIQAQNKSTELQQVEEQIRVQEQCESSIEIQLEDFFDRNHWERARESINNKWSILHKWIKRQYQIQEQLTQLEADITQGKDQIKQLKSQLHSYYLKRNELLNKATATNEEEFYLRAKQREAQKERASRKQQLANQITSILTTFEQETFNVWKQLPQESILKFDRDQGTTNLQQSEEQQRILQQELADIRNSLSQLENSEQHSEYLHRFETEKAKLQEQAKEWAQYQISLQTLTKTKNGYRRKFLPQVLKTAGTYFAELTYNRYNRLFVNTDTEDLLIETHHGQVFGTNELSRGTSDQLYISLRLSLSETMAETIGLPFIVDDAFVHFDEARLKVMHELLQGLSRSQQVILFSWREDVADYFTQAHAQSLK